VTEAAAAAAAVVVLAAVAALVAPVKDRLVVAATVATDKPVAQVGPVVSALADRRSVYSGYREVLYQSQASIAY